MALLRNNAAATMAYVVLQQSEDEELSGYTNAILREVFKHHALQCKQSVTAQISLVEEPDETSDDDWIEIGTGTHITYDAPIRWLRVKGVDKDSKVYILSVEPTLAS